MEHIDRDHMQKYRVMGAIQLQHKVYVDYQDLPMPLILVWGTKDTYVTPLKRAMQIHQQVENSKLLLVNGGHTVLFQRPAEVVDLIVSSLAES